MREVGNIEDRKVPAVYVRVSTAEQAANGYSLQEQKLRCRNYIQNHIGSKHYRLYEDEGYSGKDLMRPGVQMLFEDIIAQKVSCVVVWRLDRLSRKLTDTLLLIKDLEAANIGVVSLTQSIDTSTTLGKILLSVLSGFSELELENISQRVKMGLDARRKSGLWHGGPPYGYDYDKGSGMLVVNLEESEVVRLIFDKYLKFESIGRVRRYLIRKRIPTRGGNGWNNNTVGAILARRVYTGCIENGHGEIECPELRIIDEEAFKEAQEIRRGRAGLSPAFK